MRNLTEQEIEQVNGAGIFGSALGKLGLGAAAESINNFENKIIEATLGKLPWIGASIVNMLKDPFGAFKK
ncbi:hypothetical protein I2492_04970 [Budviciaceae bacterium CWB-B4]|uniref:Uncharacterized protein n=1 Tax=Limnobaculum xujianqingii TaxID=2738837 RepID=A0A9D7AGJ0_9GAMM|nr:hypothetical protein [Limnobaculum xujianqingii]MBK5072367.1 hypothetical protein [Limnobaculum xujianqingii]MBK5175676.1 hypothetical protein [Limnobaculum xujianqingii]